MNGYTREILKRLLFRKFSLQIAERKTQKNTRKGHLLESEKRYIYIIESFCYIHETNTIL